jgi:hypothetical protein|tara:strand:- start:1438 stop:2649 length:1212 start_codon:yes stop_codon:yes gene_type:complete
MEDQNPAKLYILKTCFFLFLSFCFISPLTYGANPSDFYGFWETQEEIGDKCVFNIKRGGRVSCFFVGSASTEITQGTWEVVDSRLVITWESGHRDALSVDNRSTLKREAYNPDSDINGAPDYIAQTYRINSRVPGSLTRSDAEIAEENEGKAPSPFSIAGPSSKDPAMKAPGGAMRNPFVGYWEVEQSPGLFFGLMADNADRFYIFLDRNGQASVSLRKTKSKNDTTGIWSYTDGVAQVTWPSGRKDILQKRPKGFELGSLGRKDDFENKPESRRQARQVNAAEAARYFGAGDIRRTTMTTLRGLWKSIDPDFSDQGAVRILSWGHAELVSEGVVKKTGKWEILSDHSLIVWDDGSRDILRDEFRRWTRATYSPGTDLAGPPAERFIVVKSGEEVIEVGGPTR